MAIINNILNDNNEYINNNYKIWFVLVFLLIAVIFPAIKKIILYEHSYYECFRSYFVLYKSVFALPD